MKSFVLCVVTPCTMSASWVLWYPLGVAEPDLATNEAKNTGLLRKLLAWLARAQHGTALSLMVQNENVVFQNFCAFHSLPKHKPANAALQLVLLQTTRFEVG